MSVTTTKDVFCDGCSQWVHGDVECTNRDARKIARGHLWKCTKKGDFCPTCVEKQRKAG